MLKIKIFHNKYYKYLVISGILWGFYPLIFKQSMLFVGILALLAGRFLGGALILLVRNKYKKAYKIHRPPKAIFIYSAFSSVVALSLFLLGLSMTTPLHASLIGLSLPFFVYALSVIILKEPVHKKVLYGGILATLGLLFIIMYSTNESSKASLVGDLLILGSQASFAVGAILARKAIKSRSIKSPEQLAFYDYAIAGVFFLVATVLITFFGNGWQPISLSGLFWIAMAATIGGIIPNVFFLKSARGLPAEKLADTNFISPIVGILAAVLIAGDSLTLSYVVGSVVVFMGLSISNDKLHPKLPVVDSSSLINLEKMVIAKSVAFEKVLVENANSTKNN